MATPQTFEELMTKAGRMYDKALSRDLRMDYWDLLQSVPDDILKTAFTAHQLDPERGRFFPRPADIMAQIPHRNPMGADEAWGLALKSFDESESLIWSAAIEQARNSIRHIWVDGDKVAARMAFKDAYARLVQDPAKRQAKLTLGTEPQGRAEAVRKACEYRIISADRALLLAPDNPPTDPGVAEAMKRLTGKPAKQCKAKSLAERFRACVDEGIKAAAEIKAAEDAEKARVEEQRQGRRKKVLDDAKAVMQARKAASA